MSMGEPMGRKEADGEGMKGERAKGRAGEKEKRIRLSVRSAGRFTESGRRSEVRCP
jgi:hypothetical protein